MCVLNYRHCDSVKNSASRWQIERLISTRRNYGQKINSWCTKTKAGVVTPSLDFFFFFCLHKLYIILFPNKRRYAERAVCFVIHHKLPYSQFLTRTNFNLRSSTVAKKAENITSACTPTSERQPSYFYRHIDTPHYPLSPHFMSQVTCTVSPIKRFMFKNWIYAAFLRTQAMPFLFAWMT